MVESNRKFALNLYVCRYLKTQTFWRYMPYLFGEHSPSLFNIKSTCDKSLCVSETRFSDKYSDKSITVSLHKGKNHMFDFVDNCDFKFRWRHKIMPNCKLKHRKIRCIENDVLKLKRILTWNTVTVPCPASSSGSILWHRVYNDDFLFGPCLLLIKKSKPPATMNLIISILSLDGPRRIRIWLTIFTLHPRRFIKAVQSKPDTVSSWTFLCNQM